MKKTVIVFLMLLVVAFIAVTIALSVASNNESDATISRIDKKIEAVEGR